MEESNKEVFRRWQTLKSKYVLCCNFAAANEVQSYTLLMSKEFMVSVPKEVPSSGVVSIGGIVSVYKTLPPDEGITLYAPSTFLHGIKMDVFISNYRMMDQRQFLLLGTYRMAKILNGDEIDEKEIEEMNEVDMINEYRNIFKKFNYSEDGGFLVNVDMDNSKIKRLEANVLLVPRMNVFFSKSRYF